jgi:hypothetical protein
MAAPQAMLMSAKEAQRLDEIEMLLGTSDSDIKESALFLDLRRSTGGHIRGDAAVDEI